MADGPVPINTVSVDDLIRLRGIGHVYAERIVAYRDEHGPYRSATDLAEVQGISLGLAEILSPDIDWRTSEEIAEGRVSRRDFLRGGPFARAVKWTIGWAASSAAWDLLKDGVAEVYEEVHGLGQDLRAMDDDLRGSEPQPEPAPPAPATEISKPTGTPEPGDMRRIPTPACAMPNCAKPKDEPATR